MIKKIKKILCLFILFAVILTNLEIHTKAAGGLSIWASASEVANGSTFSVTVQGASNYFISNLKLSVSGGTVVSGITKTSLDKGETTTATIKLNGDACVVSVSGVGANYTTETEGLASASVTVRKKATNNSNPNSNSKPNSNSNSNTNSNTNSTTNNKSKDNTLSALTVSEGTLTPTFNASTTEYNVALEATVEKITLDAKANDTKATVSGIGEKTLVPGHNKFAIVCTAENGDQKTYNIDVYVDEASLVFATYNNQKLGVVRNQTDIGIPQTFEQTTVLMDGQEVPAYHSNQLEMTIVYMVSETGEKNFYIYDEEQGITSIFRPVSILGRNVIVYDLPEEEQSRENMIYSEVTIDGTTLYGWVYEDSEFENYVLIKVINETGNKVLYQYEKTENSLQLYKEHVSEEVVQEQTLFPNEYYMYAIAGLGALCLILLISMIYFIASRKARHEGRKRKAIKRQEKARAKEEKRRLKEEQELEKQREIAQRELERQQAINEKKAEKERRKEEKKQAKQKD